MWNLSENAKMYALGVVALVVMFFMALGAHAEVPTVGAMPGQEMAILCDTKAQIRSIVKAAQDNPGGTGMVEAYKALKALKDDAGEPTCTIMPVQGVEVTSVDDVGVFTNPDGGKYHGWLVGITGRAGQTGAFLHAESADAPVSKDPSSLHGDGGTTLRPPHAKAIKDLCDGRSASSFDQFTHTRLFYCS